MVDPVLPVTDALRHAVELVTRYGGCGDNSCLFVRPAGAGTNGGCCCLDRANSARSRLLATALAGLYREVRSAIDGMAPEPKP